MIEEKLLAIDGDAVVAKIQRHIAVRAMINLCVTALKEKTVFLPGKVFAPETSLRAYREIRVLVFAPNPREGRRRIKADSLSSKGDLARLQNDPKNHITQGGGQKRADKGHQARVGFHQSRDRGAANRSGKDAAQRHPVGNNEMLKVDERPNDQQGNEEPVGDRHRPGKGFPNHQKQQRGEQFHAEISKGDFASAFCAAAAKREPADQWHVLLPWDGIFAGRTKRTTRSANGKIKRPAINADVEKRADCRAKNEGKRLEEGLLQRRIHAIRRQPVWPGAVP